MRRGVSHIGKELIAEAAGIPYDDRVKANIEGSEFGIPNVEFNSES